MKRPLFIILCLFLPLRVFISLKNGIIPEGDGTIEAGAALGRIWQGQATLADMLDPQSPAGHFLRERSTQLLYPFFLSFQPLIGWDIKTHILVQNTVLAAIMITATYMFGLRLRGRAYATLISVLMCSLTGLYWIARYAVVDNLFYAMIPLFALALLRWLENKSPASLAWLVAGFIGLALTRPESMLVIVSILGIFAWTFLRRYVSRGVLAGTVIAASVAAIVAVSAVIGSSPEIQKKLLSKAHISWGLALSANTLFNKGGSEFDPMQFHYRDLQDGQRLRPEETSYIMGRDAIAVIKANPAWFVAKIPLRAFAFLFPWAYEPWSVAHRGYEAIYTLFIAAGLILLARRHAAIRPVLPIVAIPLAIWLFLSIYGIDNDLKHRNGILVALNLVAPLGYFLPPRSASVGDRV